MKLDPKIKDISQILSPIETEEAEKYIGEMCYFADGFYTFSDLDKCPKAKLEKIHYDSKDFPYEWNEDFEQYTYILPVKFVEKPKENKYVPFDTTQDLAEVNFHIGNVINFASKKFPGIIHRAVITEVNYEEIEINYDEVQEKVIDITLGSTTYSFKTLFDEYKYLNENEEWTPFGKKV